MSSSRSRYLLVDVGSTFTKVCCIDCVGERVLAWAAVPTTSAEDAAERFEAARAVIGDVLDGDETVLAASSAAGGLRIAAVGLVPELTLAAAREAALGAGAKITGAYAYKLTDDDVAEMLASPPDMILLSGGTDGGNEEHILHNGAVIAAAFRDTPCIVAGNRTAYARLRGIFAGNENALFTENVMPSFGRLNVDAAKELIRECFIRRITIAKGLDRLSARAAILMPTPLAVCNAAQLVADGVDGAGGIGDVIVVDIGGATTDVCSVCDGAPDSGVMLKGIPEPRVKRTVEGDIGLRVSLPSLLEAMRGGFGREAGEEYVREWAKVVGARPDTLATGADELRAELLLAGAGCSIALTRHCGKIETFYTSEGRAYVQHGKDCRRVPALVGTGGIMRDRNRAAAVLRRCASGGDPTNLVPAAPKPLFDECYILWAIGLLASEAPDAALAIAKKHLVPAAGANT